MLRSGVADSISVPSVGLFIFYISFCLGLAFACPGTWPRLLGPLPLHSPAHGAPASCCPVGPAAVSPHSLLIELAASAFPLGKGLKVCWLCWSWELTSGFIDSLCCSLLCFTYHLEFHYFLLSTDFELGLLFFFWFLTVLILLVWDSSSSKM